MKIWKNIKLARYTTFHVGGPAEFFAEAKKLNDLETAVNFARKNNLKIFILGGGSNVLLPDEGIKGLVLRMNIKGIKTKGGNVYAGAGEEWDRVVIKAVANKLWGIENLSLIPGTVGGAVYQNIGAYGAELVDVLVSADVFDIKTRKIKKFSRKDCFFGYRTSVFQESIGNHYIILGASLKLSKKPNPNLTYLDLIKYFGSDFSHDCKKNTILTKSKFKSKFNLKKIRQAVIKIRKSKLDYPNTNIGTVGSFFKNPIIKAPDYTRLIDKYPKIKGKDIGNGSVKLFAGQLIEIAGWKGKKIKNVGVSKSHGLVLLSFRKATANEVKKLAEMIRKSVRQKFGINLEPEVKIITSY